MANAGRIGQFFINKYRKQAVERGYPAAAANMRKQGVPLGVALLALLDTAERLWPWDQPEKVS